MEFVTNHWKAFRHGSSSNLNSKSQYLELTTYIEQIQIDSTFEEWTVSSLWHRQLFNFFFVLFKSVYSILLYVLKYRKYIIRIFYFVFAHINIPLIIYRAVLVGWLCYCVCWFNRWINVKPSIRMLSCSLITYCLKVMFFCMCNLQMFSISNIIFNNLINFSYISIQLSVKIHCFGTWCVNTINFGKNNLLKFLIKFWCEFPHYQSLWIELIVIF